MYIPFVDLKAQYLSIKDTIDTTIKDVIDRTSFIGGELIKEFEEAFAGFSKRKYCLGCANGTDAIEIALEALEIGKDDEVLVPALTWISTGGAVNRVGAEPVFVDILTDERTIDPSLIEDKITENTKAIIPVHLYGLPARMKEIMDIANKHNLKVIEDCAQSHGAKIDDQLVGTFGDMATYSFYPGKNLGAYGDAGAIVTNEKSLYEGSRMISNHGQLQKHDHQIIGRNSRLDTMQAGILKAKLPYIGDWIDARRSHAEAYGLQLKNVTGPIASKGSKHVYHLYVIQCERRDELMALLKSNGIGCAVHYPTPLPLMKAYAYKNHKTDDFPVASRICNEIVSLPMFAELTEKQIREVSTCVNSFQCIR